MKASSDRSSILLGSTNHHHIPSHNGLGFLVFTKALNVLQLKYKGDIMAVIQFRVDDSLKAEATSVFEKLGLDLSSAMRMFLKRSVDAQGIPFPMMLEKDAYRASEARTVMKEMQRVSEQNGNSEMTLDEINEEIAGVRKERKR